jgi:23S rRNA pseudouridine1911/1915/1917 synthase
MNQSRKFSGPYKLEWNVADTEASISLKEYLASKYLSKRALTDIKFRGGKIEVNDQQENVRYRVRSNDRVRITFPTERPSEGLIAENIPLEIVYEDQDVLVVNKPAFMYTIPSKENPTGSLANAIIGYYLREGMEATVHIVTRLDQNTSGLVLLAKNRHVHHLFSLQQKKREISRSYEAFVEGEMAQESGTIEQPIGRKENSIIERQVNLNGKYACTHYEVYKQYNGYAHLFLKLMTGRTHQIRVHLSYIGHPLVGDDLYGGKLTLLNRQALHCRTLSFLHPILGETITLHSKTPQDLTSLIK